MSRERSRWSTGSELRSRVSKVGLGIRRGLRGDHPGRCRKGRCPCATAAARGCDAGQGGALLIQNLNPGPGLTPGRSTSVIGNHLTPGRCRSHYENARLHTAMPEITESTYDLRHIACIRIIRESSSSDGVSAVRRRSWRATDSCLAGVVASEEATTPVEICCSWLAVSAGSRIQGNRSGS